MTGSGVKPSEQANRLLPVIQCQAVGKGRDSTDGLIPFFGQKESVRAVIEHGVPGWDKLAGLLTTQWSHPDRVILVELIWKFDECF